MIIPILQFIQAKGAGEAVLKRFLAFSATRGAGAAQELSSSVDFLVREFGLGDDIARNIVDARCSAEKLADELANQLVEIIWLGEKSYPERLSQILKNDAPPVLFVKGNQKILSSSSVGFCGSRKASDKGLMITEKCVKQLVADEVCVVSGYASGVDMAAHKTAIENAGTTVFVLVEGILRFQNKRQIAGLLSCENHLIVSQFPPNLPWIGRNAMKRNSTIIGLSDAMILVESGLTGGTFAAGEETLKRHQPLFVVDYANPVETAEANPYFIKQGGFPIRGNRDGVPNLDLVKAATLEKKWRFMSSDEPNLFNWTNSQS